MGGWLRAAASDRGEPLDFERLISETSAALLATPLDAIDRAITAALERVRLLFGADRCALIEVSPDHRLAMVSHVSHAAGVLHVAADINLAELFPWAREQLLARAPVVVPRVADLPAEAAVDRESWESMEARSNVAVPIEVDGVVSHILAIHLVREGSGFKDDNFDRLRTLGELCANALHRKRAFDALRMSEARLHRTAAAAQCGLWEADLTTGRIWITAETCRICGLASDEDATTWDRFVDLVLPDDRARIEKAVADAFAEDGILDEVYRIRREDGSIRWLHATGRPKEGHLLLGAVQDVTSQRSREAELTKALEELQRLREQLQGENLYLRRESERTFGAKQVVGRSAAIRAALALAEQVATTNATVLLTGETGTGKERFATLIHESSPRRGRAMVCINCAAIPSSLIESELFGRERGAYTGALSRQIGRFEIADGSTLFLDEVGDLPLDVQVKLLRVLQERTFERLGSSRSLSIDVRIIAATNRNLEDAVRDGTFRSDLFYRLDVFPIQVPPLRERREDIPDLVTALVEEVGATLGKRFDSVARASLDALRQHPWPGNIRELRNVIERAMIVEAGPVLRIAVPGVAAVPAAPPAGGQARSLGDVEREHVLWVLAETGWRIRGKGGAAEVLGLKPTTLEARIERLGIRRPVQGRRNSES